MISFRGVSFRALLSFTPAAPVLYSIFKLYDSPDLLTGDRRSYPDTLALGKVDPPAFVASRKGW
ncbi:MAG: hypothetical protein QF713_05180 [Dehalococcoidales bacterium]|nr:hypothetical protein [Dehalococcoidales bacterium]MDP7525710.1 hypothetical protein [Dehalococcoidales bacterium]